MPKLTAVLALACALAAGGCGSERSAVVCSAHGIEVRAARGGDCEGAARIALEGVRAALTAVPEDARPERLVVEIDPTLPRGARPIDVIETHRPTGVVRVDSGAVERIDRGMWLHEIAHVLMGDNRPGGPAGRRLVLAVEEAVADYVAASLLGVERIGSRDLTTLPRGEIQWELLALEPTRFDAHAAGHALAFQMLLSQPGWREMLECSRRARYAGVADTPRDVLDAWLAGCPERVRAKTAWMLGGWTPSALY